MPRVMYLECFSGAAGDMVLGALLDAGLPLDQLQRALGSLGVGHELQVTAVMRAGLRATHVEVKGGEAAEPPSAYGHLHAGGHHHHGPEGGHRSLQDIEHLIGHSALSASGKAAAKAMFQRLGAAEAAIHDVPLEDVHLHEVGALDSIIDIVGIAFAMEWFGIEDVVASPLNVGGGTAAIAHGTFPVPAPATLRLLTGVPVYSSGVMKELVTPTGALVVSTYAKAYGPMPAMAVERVGYGAGSRDLEGTPNVLRVCIGTRTGSRSTVSGSQSVLKVECEIDDMSPQLFGPVSDRLFAAGALDVFLTPIFMKKGRPGTLLTVLSSPDRREAVCDLLFRETTTIGLRFEEMARETLDREWVEVAIDGGTVRIKVASRDGQVLNAAPEFDDCVRIAEATGRPVKAVQAAAMRAWSERS